MIVQPTIVAYLLLLIFSINIASTAMDKSTDCNQSCGNGSRAVHLPFPFGFTGGCKIRLNCSDSGDILIGDFLVSSVNVDTILVSLPGKCDRPIEAIKPLFDGNYAPTWHNGLLLQNCSSPLLGGCVVPTSVVETQNQFSSINCGNSKSKNLSCFTRVPKGIQFMTFEDIKQSGCGGLFSSVATLTSNNSGVSLDAQTVRLGWWLEGPCRCSRYANCTVVPVAANLSGFQCRCNEGFFGDGYNDGLGCRSVGPKGKKQVVIIVIALLISAGLFLGGLGFALHARKKKRNAQGKVGRDKEDLELPFFDLDTIANSTNNFSISNKLGEGGFGPVYKGILKDGPEIAVKRLSKNSSQGIEEFKNEVKYISKLNHRNLVKLLGCCIQGEEIMLVYEYMPNKSLDFFIFDDTHSMVLDWPKRFQIINGIARGLMYLHQDSRLRVIHRDIKAANILLDNELNPKISDFGLARSFGGNITEANTNKIVGTQGYISPEYAVDGLYSVKSDVFSFGVLVLEIISGQKNRGFQHPENRLNLLGHAWTLHRESRSSELIDASLKASCNFSEVLHTLHVGLLCVQQFPEDRPSMSAVILMLSSESVLPLPKQPGFFGGLNSIEAHSLPTEFEQCSANEVTLSLLDAR